MQLRALAALVLLLPAACGGGEGPVQRVQGRGYVQRLDLRPLAEPPPQEARQVADFVPSPDDPRWSGTGTTKAEHLPVPRGGAPEDRLPENRLPAFVVGGEDLSVRFEETLEAGTFNAVIVHADAFGTAPERLRVVLCRGEKEVLIGDWMELPSSEEGPVPISCAMPEARGQREAFDAIRVDLYGNTNLVAVTGLTLAHLPLRSFAPPNDDGAAMMAIGTEARAGWTLSTDTPLAARVRVPEGARLRYSLALIHRLRRPDQVPQIAVHVIVPERDRHIDRHQLENRMSAPSSWHEHELDLSPWAGEEVDIEFRMLVHPDAEGTGFAFVAEPTLSVPGTEAPTVLLVTSDTHRADHVGGPLVRTPTLDALGARGTRFVNAFTATNVTNPSHVCLMTGLTPRETRIVNNHSPLTAQADTLAERFRDAGFRCYAATSAFHLQDSESGLGQGFDRLDAPRYDQRPGGVAAQTLARWIDDAEGEPLFIWLHVFDAHSPYQPPAPFSGRYWESDVDPFSPDTPLGYPESIEPPPRLAALRDPDFARAEYRAGVDYVDATLGEMLGWPRLQDALVAFTADHGECFGDNGVWFDHAELYPASVHVPLLLAGPGVPQGAVVEGPARQYDVAHTLLAAAGATATGFPGQDLRDLVTTPDPAPRFLLAAHEMSAAINLGKWHLILQLRDHKEWSLEEWKRKHALELYDLEADPACSTNLAERESERARLLRARLVEWLLAAPSEGLGTQMNLTPELEEQLAALGYATGPDSTGEALIDPDCACANCEPWR